MKLGIYGGTFAPVHIGHMRAADVFLKECKLDKLLIIPTLVPPHKQINFKDNPSDRFRMLELAFGENESYGKKIFISNYELKSEPPSYTVKTLRYFSEEGTNLYFLCGTDMFLTLEEWHKPDEIFSLCTIVLLNRENDLGEVREDIENKKHLFEQKYGAQIEFIQINPIEISSSQIREGDDLIRKKYLSREVYEYIKENGLYEN